MKNISEIGFGGDESREGDEVFADLKAAREIAARVLESGRFVVKFGGVTDPSLASALREACLMAARVKADMATPYWLTLSGPNGIGKTHLARWLARRFESVLGTSLVPQVWTLGEIKRAYLGGGWGLMGELAKAPWLVLDELGAEKGNDAFREAVIVLFLARMGKWTVITTNLGEREIEAAYTARVTSRMNGRDGNVHLRMSAPDYAGRRVG
jgi:DNA replication protein DnaC